MNNPNDQKEVYLAYFIVLLASLSLAIYAYLIDTSIKPFFDIINNMFFSSAVFLLGLVFIELLSKFKALSYTAAGVFVASGIYLIWNA